jgi:sodium-dependent dicarboxylate transporter 2/3/5
MMACCAVLSSIVSNVPTCAIFMAISLDFLKVYEKEEDRKRTGRAFMIAMPVASMIGGMMTPAGSSINLLAIGQLEQLTGTTVTFVNWMMAGIPFTLIMIPLAWWLMCKIYKPAAVTAVQVKKFISEMDIPDKMDAKEIKVCVITVVMLILWIASSWVKAIDVMVVAMLGCCVMFLPGVEVLDIKDFLRKNSWDSFFLVGSVMSIGAAVIDNGVSAVIAGALPNLAVSLPVLIAFTAGLIFVSLLVIPNATSLVPIMAVPLIAIANNAGVSPAMIMMCAGLCASQCYLLPLDTVPLITYAKGYYSMTDMAKSTAFLQLAMIVICDLWLTVMSTVLGI